MYKAQGRLAVSLLVALTTSMAHGWGPEGHKLIGRIAQLKLNAHAKAKVAALLAQRHATSLADVAVWLDDLRSGTAPDSTTFSAKFPHNASWHFVNLPLAALSYVPGGLGTESEDAVQSISRMVKVLSGHGSTSDPVAADALRALVHIVGDLHQPLHAACGYWSVQSNGKLGLIPNPTTQQVYFDRGANGLVLPDGRKLHSFWDGPMVYATVNKNGGSTSSAAQALSSNVVSITPGPIQGWPAKWAIGSAGVSKKIYGALAFDKGSIVANSGPPPAKRIEAKVKFTMTEADYHKKFDADAQAQIVAAGNHLAQVLNAVWP